MNKKDSKGSRKQLSFWGFQALGFRIPRVEFLISGSRGSVLC